MADARYLLGGLLAGVGGAIESKGVQARKERLMELEHAYRTSEIDRRAAYDFANTQLRGDIEGRQSREAHQRRLEEIEATGKANRGLLVGQPLQTDEGYVGVTRGGEAVPIAGESGKPYRAPRKQPEPGEPGSGVLSVKDAAEIAQMEPEQRETMARMYEARGDATMAAAIRGVRPGESGGKRSQPLDEFQAEEAADKIIDTMAGYFSTDSSDFGVAGGDRDAFRISMQRALKAGDKAEAYRLVGKNEQARRLIDAYLGGGSPGAAPAAAKGSGRQPYRGDTPPSGFPNAVRDKYGNWIVEKDGQKFRVIQNQP